MKNLSIIILLITAVNAACDKTSSPQVIGDDVAIYLVDNYEFDTLTREIYENTITLKSEPLLAYDDIVAYHRADFAFIVSDDKKTELTGILKDVAVQAFAVTVDKEVIYWGYFWPAYMSMMCYWVTIDPLFVFATDNEIPVELAYPTSEYTLLNHDPRNDPRILGVFKRDGKLQ